MSLKDNVRYNRPVMNNSEELANSFRHYTDSRVRDGSGCKSPSLIWCNKEQSCPFTIVKKQFIKTESNDSGGSFDIPDNVIPTLDANTNYDDVHNSLDNRESENSFRNVDERPSLSFLDCCQKFSSYPAVEGCEKAGIILRNDEPVRICGRNNHLHSEVTPDVLISDNTSVLSRNGMSNTLTISHIFSKLAKNFASKKPQPMRHKAGICACGVTVADHEVKEHCVMDEKTSTCPGHFLETCGNRARSISDVITVGHGSFEDGDFIDSINENRNVTAAKNEHTEHSCELPDISADRGLVNCLKRSMSDSGRSAGSNDMSDGEKYSLNYSKSNADIRSSVLSLDMGISMASFESLGDEATMEPGNFPEGNLLPLENLELVASNRTSLDLYVDSFPSQDTKDALTVADNEFVSLAHIELASNTCELDSFPENVSLSESNASTDLSDLYSVTQSLLERNNSVVDEPLACSESYEKSSYPASVNSTHTQQTTCLRKKRDFHFWKNKLMDILQDDLDLSSFDLVQYADSSPESNEALTLTAPTSDYAIERNKFLPIEDMKDLDHQIQGSGLANEELRHGDLISEEIKRTDDTAQIIQVEKTTKDCSNKTCRRRIGVSSIGNTKDWCQSEGQQLANDNTPSGNTSPTTSTSPLVKAEESINIQPKMTTSHSANDLGDTAAITAKSSANNAVTIKPSSSDCNLAGTNRPRGLAHTNCLKTVGTAIRRISSPTKNLQLPNIFASNKCKYDLELASMAYSRSYASSSAKSYRQKVAMQMFAAAKSASFSTTTCTSIPPDTESSSSPSASPARLSKRFRSFSVDAFSSRRSSEYKSPSCCTSDPCGRAAVPARDVPCEKASCNHCGNSLLLDALFDAKKAERNKLPYDGSDGREPKKAQQFGLTLHDVKNNTGRIIPLPVEETVEFLKAVGGDEVEGLFRRCARVSTMKEVQEKYDDGEKVDYHAYGDPHLAAAILKKFLRELQEPLMTYDLFEPITRLHFLEAGKQLNEVQRILQDELPEDNYIILKYVFQFLRQVVSKSDINHMTAENVATVFGPNIAWPKGQANLASVEQAVKFALILVQHFDDVFLR